MRSIDTVFTLRVSTVPLIMDYQVFCSSCCISSDGMTDNADEQGCFYESSTHEFVAIPVDGLNSFGHTRTMQAIFPTTTNEEKKIVFFSCVFPRSRITYVQSWQRLLSRTLFVTNAKT